jgi:3-hydroxybutyryl-CoA dehydrogenase
MVLNSTSVIGVIGAGTMGRGIAQVAASKGHKVLVYENSAQVVQISKSAINESYDKLISKNKISKAHAEKIISNIVYVDDLKHFQECSLIIEAIIEDLNVKKEVFKNLESIVSSDCVLASNTSSLSIASISSACIEKSRVIGIHFFNPAPLMALVEVIPCLVTSSNVIDSVTSLISSWGKTVAIAKDTPGFIVNRIARPYYGESIRILEEGIATKEQIDSAMKTIGGFKMGPFELMDFIGNDINLKVTETIFESFFFDPKYKPSFTQKRMVEAGLLGKKTGSGYYDYSVAKNDVNLTDVSKEDKALYESIFNRVISMLINEAVDALYLKIASAKDIDNAMKLGVNYPKGLLEWCDAIGSDKVLSTLDSLYDEYREDRYRASVLLRRNVKSSVKFYE